MAHPSNTLPTEVYIVDGATATAPTGRHFCCVQNVSGASIDVAVTGSVIKYDTDAYKEVSTEQTISLNAGVALYGRFTQVTGDVGDPNGIVAYLA